VVDTYGARRAVGRVATVAKDAVAAAAAALSPLSVRPPPAAQPPMATRRCQRYAQRRPPDSSPRQLATPEASRTRTSLVAGTAAAITLISKPTQPPSPPSIGNAARL